MAEFGVSGGYSHFANSGLLGVVPGFEAGSLGLGLTPDNEQLNINQGNGFRLDFHMTLNSWKYFGHEFGYAYNRSQFEETFVAAQPVTTATGQTIAAGQTVKTQTGMGVHQGYYDFLAYARPEGKRIRPFAAGGVQFSSFAPPGSSAAYGGSITKFGFNYGAGVKVRVSEKFLVRFDYREFLCGKPNYFGSGIQDNQSGLLRQQSISTGVSFVM